VGRLGVPPRAVASQKGHEAGEDRVVGNVAGGADVLERIDVRVGRAARAECGRPDCRARPGPTPGRTDEMRRMAAPLPARACG
jgi:hypothetical protein